MPPAESRNATAGSRPGRRIGFIARVDARSRPAPGDCRPRLSRSGESSARLNARAGVQRVRFHDLRHTAAPLLLSRGVHPKIVSEMLGHSTIAITLDTYSHVISTMQREAAMVMDELLGP